MRHARSGWGGLDGAFEGGFEEVAAAFEDAAVACGDAVDGEGFGEGDEVADAFERGGAMPGGEARKGEEPGAEAGDVGAAADGDEGVAGVEGAVTFVEEAEVAGGGAAVLEVWMQRRGAGFLSAEDWARAAQVRSGSGFVRGCAWRDGRMARVGARAKVGAEAKARANAGVLRFAQG
jgi:hypothetical protein